MRRRAELFAPITVLAVSADVGAGPDSFGADTLDDCVDGLLAISSMTPGHGTSTIFNPARYDVDEVDRLAKVVV